MKGNNSQNLQLQVSPLVSSELVKHLEEEEEEGGSANEEKLLELLDAFSMEFEARAKLDLKENAFQQMKKSFEDSVEKNCKL